MRWIEIKTIATRFVKHNYYYTLQFKQGKGYKWKELNRNREFNLMNMGYGFDFDKKESKYIHDFHKIYIIMVDFIKLMIPKFK